MATSAVPKDYTDKPGENNDQTTAVIMLTSALLSATDQLIQRGIKPKVIAKSLQKAASRSAEVLLGSNDTSVPNSSKQFDVDGKITFGLANRFHGTVYFSMKPDHKFRKAVSIYAKKRDLVLENIELWFEGVKLSLDDTPKSCEVGHLDIIDIIYSKLRSRAKRNRNNTDYTSDTVHSIDKQNEGTTDESEASQRGTKRGQTDDLEHTQSERNRPSNNRTEKPSAKNKETNKESKEGKEKDKKSQDIMDDKIKLTFSDWVSDQKRRFAMGRDTEFSNIAEMFATEKGKSLSEIRLFFNGTQLDLSETPASCGLSKGDVITLMENSIT